MFRHILIYNSQITILCNHCIFLAIEMQKHMNLLLAYAFAFVLSSNFVCGCFESEKQVLLQFRNSLIDKKNTLESWVGDDCCSWRGIKCNMDGQVTILDLPRFSLKGLIPKDIGKLTYLTNLTLWGNDFKGLIPKSVANLASLSTLELSGNNINGHLPEFLCRLSKLENLDVSYNELSGTIPKCIGGLSNLKYLGLSSNSWEGSLSEQHFVNLTSLTTFYISSKSNLVFNVNSKWIPRFQLKHLYMESMNVGPEFPRWVLTQTLILEIEMPNTSISDTIPADWFASLLSRAQVVDLSGNDISVPRPPLISAPNNMSLLALSDNHLSGDFFAYTCHFTSLSTLVLSHNNLSGELPQCLENLTQLGRLDVMNNSLSGDIPNFLGSLRHLNYLNLHNNKFQGKLPLSIQNLTELRVFDVGNNNLRDILPPWTGDQLPHLRFLVLRANHFYGTIPKEFCSYSSIQVLNLAGNHITGNLPPCFNNLTAMTKTKITSENLILVLGNGQMIIDDAKGHELKYTSTLGFLFSIDLSNNNIGGEIPEELVDLRNLLNFNLAGNNLSGRIPDRIGKMEQLEYLDLSRNNLHGPIPQSISELKFLIHLNLSFNDLSGRIPTGNQLQVLDNPSSIYVGNNQLCGQPILKLCTGDSEPHEGHDNKKSDSDSNSGDEHVWIYSGIGPGLLVGFLGFCASLHFIKSWRYSYFHFVDEVFDNIALAFALSWKKFNY